MEPSVQQGKVGDQARKSGREAKSEVLILPKQMNEDDNKALGLRKRLEKDKLYVRGSISFSRRKKETKNKIREWTPRP